MDTHPPYFNTLTNMRGKRTHPEVKAEVIAKKLEDPSLSGQDISDILWGIVSTDTVRDIVNKDLPKVARESTRIAEFVDANEEIISIWQRILMQNLPIAWEKSNEMWDLNSLSSILERAFKQNQLVGGKATENVSHSIKDYSKASNEELEVFIKDILTD